jgi:hypothetical protein
MPKTHSVNPANFHADAIAPVQRTDQPLAAVTAVLGVSDESLRTWGGRPRLAPVRGCLVR